jgi:hypothetical protein
MTYRTLLAPVSLTLSLALSAQAPISLVGENTEGHSVELPKASAGRYCLVAIGASKKAEPALQEWYEPAYLRFIAKQGLMVSDHEVDLWLVPIFTGLNKAGFGPSMKRLKEEADPEVAARVVFVKDDAAALLQALGIKDRDVPYFLLFDAQGKLVHREQGAYSVEKLDALEEAMN